MAVTISPGMVVTPDIWDALFEQHGRAAPSVDPTNVSKKPADDGYLPRDKQQPVYRYFLADGTTVDARTSADGQGWEVVDYKPSQKFVTAQKEAEKPSEEEGAIRGPQTGPTREVKRGGQWVVEPNPVYQAPGEKESIREGDTRGPQTGKTREVYRGGKWVTEPNPVYQEPKPEERAPGVQTVQGGDGQTYTRVVTMGPNNTPIIKQYGPNGQEVAAIPGEKEKPSVRQQQGSDGQTYTIVTTMDANNRPTVQTFDPSGKTVQAVPVKPVVEPDKYTSVRTDPNTGESMGLTRGANPHWEVIPVQGQEAKPTTRAPSMQQIVVGFSQDALRQAYDDIQAEVDAGRRTPAWGENRRKEVFETAQLAVNEAHLHEQSRQFNQTTAYNVANARMGNQQGVLEFAVRTALSINGRLKKGSSAGGELFRNLFMLGMQMQQASGINDIRPGGGQSSVGNTPGQQGRAGNPATRPPMDPGDTKAHAASADQAAANLAANATRPWTDNETGPSVVNPGQPTPAAPPAATAPAPTGAPTGAPTAATASAVAPSAPPTSVPVGPPPAAGQIRIRRTAVGPGGGTVGFETNVSQQDLDRQTPEERARWEIVTPAAPAVPAPQAMAQPEPRFAAMEQFRMPQVDPMAPPVDPMQGAGMPAALRHADVLNALPWRLPPEQLPDLVKQFGEDTVYSWPGMPREGAA